MGSSNAPHIMTLVNSIIGVSILAMPFCYKQCGILLATLILIFSNLMTRLSCYYLLKSAIMTRRRTFELLAFHAFGNSGKTAVELSIILLMIGTCIAFFVVMGDLGPAIIGSLLEIEYFAALRPAVLIGLAVIVVLPLGLLRNVDSLASICTASFLFYLFLVFKVFVESTNNLFSGSWINEIEYWRPAGILQCLPIFSMALSCQTQLLEIFDSVTNGTLDRMNSIVKSAVNLCTALYISVGFFGYIAYYKQTFSGNLLMSFSESYFSEFIKLGFVLSVAVTFPMVIFPCRTSLHSLLFKKVHVPHYELVTGGGNHIPEAQFKCITLFIITSSLVVGLLAPNIEIVLGLLGSTIGVIICVLCPPCLFIWISNKATTEKVLAQMMCALGIFIMIMGTYTNLYMSESASNVKPEPWKEIDPNSVKLWDDSQKKSVVIENNRNLNDKNELQNPAKNPEVEKPVQVENKVSNVVVNEQLEPKKTKVEEKRIEPPIPVDPMNDRANSQDQKDVPSKRVEPPVPVSPEVINAPAKIVDPQPELTKSKELEGPAKNDKLRSNAEESPKSLSNRHESLLKEQKDVLKRIREKKREKLAADSEDSIPKQNENNGKVAVQEDKIAEKVKVERPVAGAKIVSNGDVKEAPKRVPDKPPLPILKNGSVNAIDEKKSSPGVLQRDILANEREKRDLYFVANAPLTNADSRPKLAGVNDVVDISVIEANKDDGSFVKQVAKTVSDNPTCEKKEGESVSVSKISRNDDRKKEDAVVAENPGAINSVKENVQSGGNNENAVIVSSNSPKVTKLREEKQTAEKAGVIPVISKLSQKEESDIMPDTGKESANVNNVEKNENMILAPSKLSEPVVVLQDKLEMGDHVKPAVLDLVKPMQRELKMVNHKENSGNRKK